MPGATPGHCILATRYSGDVETTDIAKLRKKVAYTRGRRKSIAEAELAEKLISVDSAEALTLARTAFERAEALAADAKTRKAEQRPYLEAQAEALRVYALALKDAQRFAEAEQQMLKAMELSKSLNNVEQLIRCHLLMYLLYRDLGQYQQALDALDRALLIGQQGGYSDDDAELHGGRGIVLALLGLHKESIDAFELGLEIAARRNDHHVRIVVLGNYGTMSLRSDKLAKAEELFRTALDLDEEKKVLGPKEQVAFLWNLIKILRVSGNITGALETVEKGISVASGANLAWDQSLFVLFKAQLLLICADYPQAHTYLQQLRSLEVFKHNSIVAAKYWSLSAQLYSAIRDDGSAATAAQNVLQYLEDIPTDSLHQRLELMGIISSFAAIERAELSVPDYISLFRESIEAYSHSVNHDQTLITGMRLVLGALHEKEAKKEAAFTEYNIALQLCREKNLRLELVRALLGLGRLRNVSDEHTFAVNCLSEALDISIEIGAREWQLKAHRGLAQIFERTNKPAEALYHLQQLRALEQEVLAPRHIFPIWLSRQRSKLEEESEELALLKRAIAELEKQHEAQQRVLQTRDTRIAHLSDSLASVEEQLARVSDESDADYHRRISQLRASIPGILEREGWSEFEAQVSDHDDDFLKRLSLQYPKLTATERKICSLIRLNNTSKDLARLLNIAPRSVQAYRYRIRKKLDLTSATDLNAFILEL